MVQGSNPHNFVLMGGRVGVLVLNESASAQKIASEMVHTLHLNGHTVALSAPERPIENWGDIREHEWPHWLTQSQELLSSMRESCESVFVVGISMGSTLALRLAELYSDHVDGLVIVEPSFPNLKRSHRAMWSAIRGELANIVQPLIQMYSHDSGDEAANNAALIANNISSPFIRELVLDSKVNDSHFVIQETAVFIGEVEKGLWLADSADTSDFDDSELIDAEFQSIVEGLSLDESTPNTYLDQLEYLDSQDEIEHFNQPDPVLAPIVDPRKRRAIIAMILGPIYTLVAAITYFDPLGVEPWPGILAFIGGLAYFFYALRDTPTDDDGAIL
jgi:carboxylesterase